MPAARAAGLLVVAQAYVAARRRVTDEASRGPLRSGAADYDELNGGGAMAKYHSRPSAQYRYEHYDPR